MRVVPPKSGLAIQIHAYSAFRRIFAMLSAYVRSETVSHRRLLNDLYLHVHESAVDSTAARSSK